MEENAVRFRDHRGKLEPWAKRSLVAAAAFVFLLLAVDDWSRDFIANHAEITESTDGEMRALVSNRSVPELIEALKWAARRVGGSWEFIGTVGEGENTYVMFERQGRLLRMTEDVTVCIRSVGDGRLVTAVSQSRHSFGDLGRNPRNLRRLFEELRHVLDGSTPSPAPFAAGGTS